MGKDVDDPSDLAGRARRQLERVREGVEHDGDRNAILGWANEMLTRDLSPATVTNRVNPVMKLHERADKPLVEFDCRNDVIDLLAAFGDGSHPDVKDDGLGDGTLRAYRQAAKLFFRDELGHEWGDDIIIGAPDASPITEDQILTNDDVDALLEAATTPRDAAMVAFLTVTGQRISAMLSLRVGDITVDGQTATARLNSDAVGLKGASGPRPLLWARSHIVSWRSIHPRARDPDAPFFCAVQSGSRPARDGSTISWEAGDALSPSQVRARFKTLASRAGVDTAKVKPHNFRHTAITRMRDEGVSDDRIKFMVGVAQDSDILERYDKQSDDRMMDRIRDAYGMDTQAGSEVGQPSMEACPHCGVPLRSSARFCDSCGTELTQKAAEERKAASGVLTDEMVSRDDPAEREMVADLLDDVEGDGAFVEAVADRVMEQLDDDH